MASTFVRLYLLLVFAILGVGYGLDHVWQIYGQDNPHDLEESQLMAMVSLHLQASNQAQWPNEITAINQHLSTHFSLLPATTFNAGSATEARLKQGEIIAMQDQGSSTVTLKKLPHSSWLLMHSRPASSASAGFEKFLVFAFYAVIALVVLLWIWPFSRALGQLETAAQAFGSGDWTAEARVKEGSPVAPLAQAFNQMAQRIRDLIRAHKDFSNAVSHELRTPLARMKFALAMAADSQDEKVLRKNLSSIAKDAAEMDQLVNELLNYATIETKETSLNLQQGDFRSLVQGKIEQLQPLVTRPLSFVFHCHDANTLVLCDSNLMERALQNLLQNASRYAEHQIHVEFRQLKNHFQLTVDDDGPGIPIDAREQVFDAFVRIDDAGNRKGQGFGLGLAIVKRIAQCHQGLVYIESSTLGGARFVLQWPVDLAMHSPQSDESKTS